MPDLKFADPAIAKRMVLAENYPEHARRAIREMHRQVGDLVCSTTAAWRCAACWCGTW